MVGPTIGAALYDVGGFGAPFWFIGIFMICSGFLIFACLPEPQDLSSHREGSMFSLLKSPMVWVTMFCVMSGSCGLAFLEPTLSDHLDGFGLSTLAVGLFFVIVPGIQACAAPLWGYFSDTKNVQSPLLIVGNLVCAVGYMFIGPTPLLPFLPRELWTVTVGLILYGFTLGCSIVPTMKCFVIGARELGFPDNLNTFGLVSGLFNSVFCLGAFIGPTIGGALIELIDFYYGSTVIAGVYLTTMTISLLFFGLRRIKQKRRSKIHAYHNGQLPSDPVQNSSHEEKTPLIHNESNI